MGSLLSRITGSHQQTTVPSEPLPQKNDLRVVGINDAATQAPLIRIQIFPGVITYDEGMPLIAADGAPISSTGPNQWAQLYAAGRT